MAASRPALLFLGFDGVDPAHLTHLCTAGELPALSQLAEQGAMRPIASTVPPATSPAWATCLTGVNPGRHGVFDFATLDGYRVCFGSPRPGVPTWLETLGEQGFSVGAIGFPGRLHGPGLTGFHVAGWDTPLETQAGPRHVYPPWLCHRVRKELGPDALRFAAADEFAVGVAGQDAARFLGCLAEGIEQRVAVALFLARERPVDVLAIHFQAADTAGHHLWPRPGEPGDTDAIPDGLVRVLRMLDAAVRRLLDALAPAAVVAVSDHGMGPAANLVVSLNGLLASGGFQTRIAEGTADRVASRIRGHLLRYLPVSIRELVLRGAGSLLPGLVETRARFGGIDWARTVAFSDDLTYAPTVRLNVRGREPQGIVDPGERRRVAEDVAAFLRSVRHPDGGWLFRSARFREEVYEGPFVERAADLVLELAADVAGRTPLLCPPHLRSYLRGNWWMRIPAGERAGGKGSLLRGTHRPCGVVLAAPAPAWLRQAPHHHPAAQGHPGRRSNADGGDGLGLDLRDVAALVHELLGCDEPPHLERPRRRTGGEMPFLQSAPAPDGLSASERRVLARRLAALGYVEDPDP